MCALCRRNLLAGERFRYWRAGTGRSAGRVVCFLCEREATRDGWERSEQLSGVANAIGLRASVRRVA
jgi:hypothetical protein